ncbi:transcriptional regulator BetI [Larsenimonas suaedae]|uniref:HTH-type transcriptional regulator BetI n=1 Tax=Larsenimonas suaedae TaxID=1851019 RepID=A0ABU1GUE9_9GAMM|nr:transcriptional regulator BetI [Larsenimonas suaedae]MCM2970956.1 transcriptional regulator BetI [Larsenimonas suaedae]MDR5895665.1 transcriptional regulator BetI [Larsenimonas suaedae]
MPKVGMEPIRRHQLIQATMQAIDEAGLADTTIARIARTAGVSTGIISHYFGGKDGLLEATMRFILAELGATVSTRRRALGTSDAKAHLRAIVEANFDDTQVSRSVMKTWLAFWATSMHRDDLMRLQRVNDRRLYSNLCCQFRKHMPRRDAQEAARGLAALIDGLWLRGALAPEGLNAERAIHIAFDYIDEKLTASTANRGTRPTSATAHRHPSKESIS